MSHKILALDVATTPGAALLDGDRREVWHWTLSGSLAERGIHLSSRLTAAINRHHPDLVAYEEPQFVPRSQRSASVRYGLLMVVQMACESRKVPYIGVDPYDVKECATGRRGAEKHEVRQAAQEVLRRGCTEDEADALFVGLFALKEGVKV